MDIACFNLRAGDAIKGQKIFCPCVLRVLRNFCTFVAIFTP